jgi:hypothetical protein
MIITVIQIIHSFVKSLFSTNIQICNLLSCCRRSEVLTDVVTKLSVFWGILVKKCNPLKFNRRFGGTYRRNLQGWRLSQTRNQPEEDKALLSASYWFISCLVYPWRQNSPLLVTSVIKESKMAVRPTENKRVLILVTTTCQEFNLQI